MVKILLHYLYSLNLFLLRFFFKLLRKKIISEDFRKNNLLLCNLNKPLYIHCKDFQINIWIPILFAKKKFRPPEVLKTENGN